MDPINKIPNLGNLQRGPDYLMTPANSTAGNEVEIFSRRDLFDDPATAHDVWAQIAMGINNSKNCDAYSSDTPDAEPCIWDEAVRVWVGICDFYPFKKSETVARFTQWCPVMIVLKFDGTEEHWAYDMDLQQMVTPWFDLATGEMNA